MATITHQYEQLPPITRLGIALLLMGSCGWYFFDDMIVPKQETLVQRQAELDKIVTELKESNPLTSPVSMEEELNKANREYKKMIELLPDEPAVEKILNDFASLSRLSGVEIREFMPTTAQVNDRNARGNLSQGNMNYSAQTAGSQSSGANPFSHIGIDEVTNSITISVKLQGTFASMVSFMDMVMSLPRVVRIEDFEIMHEERELKLVQRPKLSFTGKFTAYYQRGFDTQGAVVAEKTDTIKPPQGRNTNKPVIDINSVLDTSFSAKGGTEP